MTLVSPLDVLEPRSPRVSLRPLFLAATAFVEAHAPLCSRDGLPVATRRHVGIAFENFPLRLPIVEDHAYIHGTAQHPLLVRLSSLNALALVLPPTLRFWFFGEKDGAEGGGATSAVFCAPILIPSLGTFEFQERERGS